jgi:HSP20 family protein
MANKSLLPWWRSEQGLMARDPFAALQKEMNDLFDGFLGGRREGGFAEFSPKVDLIENDKEIKVTAELPGMEEKDIEISAEDDMLVLKGEKRHEKEEKTEETYRLERSYGSFRRHLPLPCKVDGDKAKATFSKGVLTIVLPKAPVAAQGRKIKVEAA